MSLLFVDAFASRGIFQGCEPRQTDSRYLGLPASFPTRGFMLLAAALTLTLAPHPRLPLSLGCQDAIEVGFQETRELMRRHKWKEMRAKLIELVPTDSIEGEEVLPYWTDLEDGLALAAFWENYELPKPKDVVAGKLLSWKESSGKIKLRYKEGDGGLAAKVGRGFDQTGEASGDFIHSGDYTLHPALFKGPYSVEVEGKELSKDGGGLPYFLVDWRWSGSKGFDYGIAYGVAFSRLTKIFEISSGEVRVLDSSSCSLKAGRPYSFKVSVSASSISAFYNGRRLLKIKRPKSGFGQFGFSYLNGIEQVTITGEIEPAWIAGLIDDRVVTDWAAFREGYDPLDDLPTWVRERVKGSARGAREFGEVIPGPVESINKVQFQRVVKLLGNGAHVRALEEVNELGERKITTVAKNWLLANLLFLSGKSEEGFTRLQKVTHEDPMFYEGRLLEAIATGGLRTREAGIDALEALILDFPEYLEPYEELGMLQLFTGQPEEAAEVLKVAIENGIPPAAIAGLSRTLSRSAHGPAMGERFVYESKNYIVTSDLSRAVCFEIGNELEKFYRKYIHHVRRPDSASKRKFQVYFFSGSGGYQAYLQDILGDPGENTLGIYSPWLKQLVLWNSPEKALVMRTVRHEGFHQYFDRITSEAPVWLNEGMAEYFEQARLVRGSWKDDQVNEQHVALLRNEKKWTALEELVYGDNRHFRSRPSLHYAESWAFVHFLFNSNRDNRRIIETLLDALSNGEERVNALDASFEGADWEALSGELWVHIRGL